MLEPRVNRPGVVPASVKFSVAPFLPDTPRVSVLYHVISALKRVFSYDTALKHGKGLHLVPS